MATVTKGKTFTSGETVTPTKLNEIVDLATVTNIVNADISATAAIADTKLATISTVGKVSNSATTATNANTPSAIVARDASGNFSAGTITGNVTGNLTGTAATVADGAVTTAKIAAAAVTAPKLQNGVTLQTVYAQTTARQTVGASASHAIPADNTKPQNTEGLEVLTATITPSSATSKILIQAAFTGTQGSAGTITAALFRDSGADALATSWVSAPSNYAMTLPFAFQDAPATTSAVTYKIRLGYAVGGGGLWLNGTINGAELYNSTTTSWMTLTEIKA